MASSSSSPCAACKFLRRKCTTECVFAPYFPPDQPHKFANVHKIFGASNITKLLNELPPHQREDAVNSLAYEADARVKDPVYGCVGAISVLQRQVAQLQAELALAHSDLAKYAGAGLVPAVGPSGAGTGPSLGIGMGVGMAVGVAGSREPQHMMTRDQLMELGREPSYTREQIMEMARVGGAGAAAAAAGMATTSYEAAGGAGVSLASRRQLGGSSSYHATRANSDGNSGGSGGAGTSSMGHMSSG